jgi:Fibronectin type III domain/FG-GAP-like repeat
MASQGPPKGPPKMQNSIVFLIILLPSVVWHGLVALGPRTIAFGVIGLLFLGFVAQVQAQATSNVTLAWYPPNNPSGIAGYRLYYGPTSGNYTQVIDVGNTTVATAPNLVAGQTYYFVVTDYSAAGIESPPSNQVVYQIPFPAPNPNSPPPTAAGAPPSPAIVVSVPNPPDFDGDGKQDLLWRNTSSGQVGVWLMNGSRATAVANLGSPPLSWVIINTGDFDGSGRSDILWQLANTNQYGVWFMNGTQAVEIQNFALPPFAGQICCVADFDGDGLADLVTFNRSAGNIYFWKNNGSLQFVQETSYVVGAASGWLPVGTANLNGPGETPALIWRNANTGEIAAWFMSSFTWSAAASFGSPGNTVRLCGFGDFSGNGSDDLLLFDTSNDAVGYWQSNGAQQPSSVFLAFVGGDWVPVRAENLSGTSNADIIWRQTSTGALGAWQVNGSTYSIPIGSSFVGPDWQIQPAAITP